MDIIILLSSIMGIITICTVAVDRKNKRKFTQRIHQRALRLQQSKEEYRFLLEQDKYTTYKDHPDLLIWDDKAKSYLTRIAIQALRHIRKEPISIHFVRGEIGDKFYISADRPIGDVHEAIINTYYQFFDRYGVVEMDIYLTNRTIRTVITIITGYEETNEITVPQKKAA